MFEQKNTLPGTKLEFSITDRRGLASTGQDHTYVRWHVVASFGIVCEVIRVFRHQSIEEFLQITRGGGIRIFHDHQAATGVLNEKGCRPAFYPVVIDP